MKTRKGVKKIVVVEKQQQKVFFGLENKPKIATAVKVAGVFQTQTFTTEFLIKVVEATNKRFGIGIENPTTAKKGAKKQLFAVVFQTYLETIGLNETAIKELLRLGLYLK